MPIYEYLCQNCGKAFNHLHKRLAEPAPACPQCQSRDVKKQFSTFSAGKISAASGCSHAEQCPSAAASGHNCCAGCSHRHP